MVDIITYISDNIGYIYTVGGKRQTTSVSLKCYECVFIGCSVYSVVDSQFRRDVFVFFMDCLRRLRQCFLVGFRDVFSSILLYVDGSSLQKLVVLSAAISSLGSFLIWSVFSFSLLRKGLFTCLNFTDWIIFSMSSSKSFNSSMEGGFLVDLKPYVSLVNEVVSGLRKEWAFQRILCKERGREEREILY